MQASHSEAEPCGSAGPQILSPHSLTINNTHQVINYPAQLSHTMSQTHKMANHYTVSTQWGTVICNNMHSSTGYG